MARFVAVYTGAPDGPNMAAWKKLDDATRKAREQEGMQAWMKWGETHKDKIVVGGGPLGKTKSVGKNGVHDIRNNLAGYIVVEAASHEEAAAMFVNHPHFSIFPGEAVEVMPELPIPGM